MFNKEIFNSIYLHDAKYYILIAIWIISIISASVIFVMDFDKDKKGKLSSKNTKFRKINKNNIVKDIVEQIVEEKLDYKRRRKVEGYLLQSGYNLSIVDLYIIRVISAILLSCIVGFMFKNIFLLFVFLIVGFILPKEFIVSVGKKRKEKLNTQVGTFINVVIGRYEMLNDFSESLRMSIEECYGQEPIATEIRKTIMDLDLGLSVNEALDNMTLRTGNKHIQKLANNYKVATSIGTKEARKRLLGYVIDEYNQETVSITQLKRELKGPVMEAYLMCGMVPAVMLMQVFLTEGYLDFMVNDTLGKIGMSIIVSGVLMAIWFINVKVNAPLE